MTLISNSQTLEELNYAPTWPSRQLLLSHICMISHDTESASYNAMINSGKGTVVESLNARKAMQVNMVNPFQLNGLETQGFTSAKQHAPFCSTEPACIKSFFMPDTS